MIRRIPEGPIKRVGLTGSIATGKSLAASFFAGQGIAVIDADLLARKAVMPGTPALREIRERFGPGVLLPDGSLDRAALGKLIFSDEKARHDLNSIVHPEVAREAELEFCRALEADPDSFVVYNVPLLFETGMEEGFDLIVVVAASPAAQLQRLTSRDGFTPEEARKRIASQMDIFKKARLAGAVLENEGSVEELRSQVEGLAALIRDHNRKT